MADPAAPAGQTASVSAFVALTLAVAALLVLVLFDITAVALARRQATTAAENAALAAAAETAPTATGNPTRMADWVAITNAARMERCECRMTPVVVTVSVEVRAPLLNRLGLRRVTATATADLMPTWSNG